MAAFVGITGGIGTGKSTVSKFYEDKGFPVLYADNIAKNLLANDDEIKSKIISEFGEKAYINSTPNKKFLAEQVFNSPEKLEKINAILHPATIEIIKNEFEKLRKNGKVVFTEAALIYEADFSDIFDFVISVAAEKETRIGRLISSGKFTKEEVEMRMNSQMPDEAKNKKADFVIHNNGTVEELYEKCEFILSLIFTLEKKAE
ncbi:MAG: dephospho-CoA kinase [Chlorobi bacterium]|nr:dephospho-CoA kinase [Chlorobiota bacterium]